MEDHLGNQLGWFRQLLELRSRKVIRPRNSSSSLKVDLYHDEIFIFTPQGDVKQMTKGATAIDFAFHVHTDVSLHTSGAKVNGRIAPLHPRTQEWRYGRNPDFTAGTAAEPGLVEPRAYRTCAARSSSGSDRKRKPSQSQASAARFFRASSSGGGSTHRQPTR